jgi:hypothetical protein
LKIQFYKSIPNNFPITPSLPYI